MGGTLAHTPYTHGHSNSANYNGDVVQMHYIISIAKYDTNAKKKVLASSASFTWGVSVSSVSWGFVSPGAISGDKDSTRINFTLHDIAGSLIGDIMDLRNGSYWIYFQGPTSLGLPWMGKEAIFFPTASECKIEFSATQGFTYTFSGTPITNLAKTKFLATKAKVTLTGEELGKGANFRQYLENNLVNKWNENIKDSKKPMAQIQIKCSNHTLFDNLVNTPIKNEGGGIDRIEPFDINIDTTIADAIRNLFNTRFKVAETTVQASPDGTIAKKPTLEITFHKWEGKKVLIGVDFIDNKDEKVISNMIPVCIGSDLNCLGSTYRGQLVSMDFGPLYSLMGGNAIMDNQEGSSVNGKNSGAQAGNDGSAKITGETTDKARDGQQEDTELEIVPTLTRNENGSWGLIDTALDKAKVPKFTIDIEMPYAYGFTPEEHGGVLTDAIKGATGSGIHYTQGVDLEFYWYIDPTCSVLVKQPKVSGTYRLAKVMHTIGLNGNTTQITIAHQNMS